MVGIDVPDPAIGAVDAIANRPMQQRVRHILTKLSESDRCLLAAVFLDERDKDEVCRSFAVSREYLRVALWRAKKSFRAMSLQETEDPQDRLLPSKLPTVRRSKLQGLRSSDDAANQCAGRLHPDTGDCDLFRALY